MLGHREEQCSEAFVCLCQTTAFCFINDRVRRPRMTRKQIWALAHLEKSLCETGCARRRRQASQSDIIQHINGEWVLWIQNSNYVSQSTKSRAGGQHEWDIQDVDVCRYPVKCYGQHMLGIRYPLMLVYINTIICHYIILLYCIGTFINSYKTQSNYWWHEHLINSRLQGWKWVKSGDFAQ